MNQEDTIFRCNDGCDTLLLAHQFSDDEFRMEIEGPYDVVFLSRKQAKQLRRLLKQFIESAKEME